MAGRAHWKESVTEGTSMWRIRNRPHPGNLLPEIALGRAATCNSSELIRLSTFYVDEKGALTNQAADL